MVEPSTALQVVFDKAVSDAKKLQHEYVTLEHLLYAMLCEESFENIIVGYGADPELMKKNLENYLKTKLEQVKTDLVKFKPKKTATVERVLSRAFTQVLFQGRNAIEVSDVFISILSEKRSYAFFITTQSNINKDTFVSYMSAELDDVVDEEETENQGVANKALRTFTADLNHDVKKGKIDPVIGRDEEIEQLASKYEVTCDYYMMEFM